MDMSNKVSHLLGHGITSARTCQVLSELHVSRFASFCIIHMRNEAHSQIFLYFKGMLSMHTI